MFKEIFFVFISSLIIQADTLPDCKCSQILHHIAYTACYSDSIKESKWVEYHLKKSELITKRVPRTNKFLVDPLLNTIKVNPDDYAKSGYDRGHMVPAKDMEYDSIAELECFYMTNMVPQLPGFNRGIWKRLEMYVRSLAMYNTDLIVITGPVLDSISKTIAEKIIIPKACYKLIMDSLNYECFVIPNKVSKANLNTFRVTADSLFKLTGINFKNRIGERTNALYR